MPSVDELVLTVRQLTRDAFIAQNPIPFLVCKRDAAAFDNEWSFRTQTLSTGRASMASLMATEGFTLSDELLGHDIYPLQKTQRNPWRDRVSVGRARNNDIVLLDKSVSKLHAHFFVENGGVRVQDVGSRNGTRVGDNKLNAGEPTPVAMGSTIAVGRVEMVLLDSGGLYDFINENIRPAPKH